MIKKVNGLLILMFLVLMVPLNAAASGMSREYYPPNDSDYYQKKFSYQLYSSTGVVKIRFTQYKSGLPMDPTNVITTTTWNVKENSTVWVDQSCKGPLSFEYLDSTGTVVDSHVRGETTSYLNQGSCSPGDVIKPSDFNEEANQYKSDTFGGTKTQLTNPPTSDGSGGTGSTGYVGIDDGSGTGGDTGGTDPGTGEGSCIGCELFNCPGWSDYMGKLDQIKSSIPPAPNWDDVAGKFRDSIVPRLVSDLENMLGSSPAAPTPPPQLPGTDDRGINSKTPVMNDVPGLKESGFSSDKIKTDSPEVQFREDPTGGFDLIQNPIDTLPSLPGDSFPKPGSTDPGEWGQNKPIEQENPFPFPQDTGEPGTGEAPTPTDSGATPPSPGTDSGTAPIPGGDSGTAPIPGGGGTDPGMIDYKPSPESPDGSGGDI